MTGFVPPPLQEIVGIASYPRLGKFFEFSVPQHLHVIQAIQPVIKVPILAAA